MLSYTYQKRYTCYGTVSSELQVVVVVGMGLAKLVMSIFGVSLVVGGFLALMVPVGAHKATLD